ncbi:MAG TPA: hypothetical protein VFV66_11450 [Nonomuraea sp.]|nr:hypothetical protein [Nonomuraea sp.]
MRTRHAALAAALLAAALITACSSTQDAGTDTAKPKATSSRPSAPAARELDTAQGIVDALNDAGFTASTPKERTDGGYVSKVGGTSYGLTITDKAGQTAPGETGINMFPNPEALQAWIPLSKSFGGVAVTGDTWAVSLPTKTKDARADSLRIAPRVAEALDGTVQR